MRLFVAIDIPDDTQQQIAKLYCNFHNVQWSAPERLHITLAFLGEVAEHQLPTVNEVLGKIHFTPFEIATTDFGSFKSGDIWFGVTPQEPIIQLHQLITERLTEAGLNFPSRRTFKPHITLAYTRKNEEHLVLNLLAGRKTFASLSFRVENFCLKSSWRKSTGALHRIEAVYPAKP